MVLNFRMLKEDEHLKKLAENFSTNLKKSGASESSVLISNSISESVNIRNKKLDGSTRSDSLNVVLTAYCLLYTSPSPRD